jgi:mRNA-degrading endonuclease RelE of RelBE toxin-antitoxin system
LRDQVRTAVGTIWEQLPHRANGGDNYGYNLARVPYEIVLAPGAAADLKGLSAPVRTGVKDAIERHLRHEPTKASKSRIKRLRGLSQPQYRLRVGDIRVFYDVTEAQVQILAVVTKEQTQAWLEEQGTSEDDATSGGAGGGKG